MTIELPEITEEMLVVEEVRALRDRERYRKTRGASRMVKIIEKRLAIIALAKRGLEAIKAQATSEPDGAA